jgi:hypothetical protein
VVAWAWSCAGTSFWTPARLQQRVDLARRAVRQVHHCRRCLCDCSGNHLCHHFFYRLRMVHHRAPSYRHRRLSLLLLAHYTTRSCMCAHSRRALLRLNQDERQILRLALLPQKTSVPQSLDAPEPRYKGSRQKRQLNSGAHICCLLHSGYLQSLFCG